MPESKREIIGRLYRCCYCDNVFEAAEAGTDSEGFEVCPECGHWEFYPVARCAHCGGVFAERMMWGEPDDGNAYCEDCLNEAIDDPVWVGLFLDEKELNHSFAEFCAEKERSRQPEAVQ